VQITEATVSDAERVAELAARTFPLACPPAAPAEDVAAFVRSNLSPERFAEYATDAERVVLLADDGTGLSGYAMLVFAEPYDSQVAAQVAHRPTVELSKIYVAPEHHGAGVAAELMAAAIRCAGERGAASVWLGTNEENRRAQRFYEKNGFARVGVRRFRLGARLEDDFVFERVLNGSSVSLAERRGAAED
jgi:ribosomal protein S18 acetylase RimI-like enzyme